MHWYTYDRATWGIIMGVAAIILAFPLSLLANLVTPKIRNWWAERSLAALTKRIAKLEWAPAKMQRQAPLSRDQRDLLAPAQLVAWAIVGMIYACVGILEVLSRSLSNALRHHVIPFLIMANFLAVAALVLLMGFGRRVRERAPSHIGDLEASIRKLSAKLQLLQKS